LAQRTIRESGIGKMARRDKSLVDKVSAAIILQDYMSSKGL
jgi:putative Holliday junction resolvase